MSNGAKLNMAWWSEEYGFFGDFYMEGDNSKEGYLIKKQQSLAQRTATEVDGIVRLLSLSIGSLILDCPSGYGRHSTALAERGFVVTGSDINASHLIRAEQEAKTIGVQIKWKKENMLHLSYENEFDAVINLFYSFGFFDTDRDNEKVLRNFCSALKPGGKFLLHTDVNLPRVLAGKYKSSEKRTLPNGKTLAILDTYDPTTKRMNGSWIINDERGYQMKKDYSVRVYTRGEIEDLCKKVGFKSCEAYADWDGTPYHEDAEDMIIVARR